MQSLSAIYRGLNHPAAGKAGFARQFAIEHHCPGLPEPGRWTTRAAT
jgi:hypothetical protein